MKPRVNASIPRTTNTQKISATSAVPHLVKKIEHNRFEILGRDLGKHVKEFASFASRG